MKPSSPRPSGILPLSIVCNELPAPLSQGLPKALKIIGIKLAQEKLEHSSKTAGPDCLLLGCGRGGSWQLHKVSTSRTKPPNVRKGTLLPWPLRYTHDQPKHRHPSSSRDLLPVHMSTRDTNADAQKCTENCMQSHPSTETHKHISFLT